MNIPSFTRSVSRGSAVGWFLVLLLVCGAGAGYYLYQDNLAKRKAAQELTTERKMKEKKARVDDALHATRAAVEEGIVPGGGVALIRAQKAIDTLKLEGDEETGAQIVYRAVEAPLRQLASNAGREGALIVAKVKGMKKAADGYNVATDKYEDLLTAGVVDPTKVTRSALQNAASIAGLLLTTECVIADKPEKKGCGCGSGAPDMGGMGGMGGMGMM